MQKKNQSQQRKRKLLEEGNQMIANAPLSEKRSIHDLMNWFYSENMESVKNHDAFDLALANFISTHTFVCDLRDLNMSILGSKGVPFIRTFHAIIDQNKKRPPSLQLDLYVNIRETFENFPTYHRSISDDTFTGYYNAPSDDVRKRYIDITHTLMKNGFDIVFPHEDTDNEELRKQQNLNYIIVSPLFVLSNDRRYEFIGDLASELDMKRLLYLQKGLIFLMENYKKCPKINQYYVTSASNPDEISLRLSNSLRVIENELRRRITKMRNQSQKLSYSKSLLKNMILSVRQQQSEQQSKQQSQRQKEQEKRMLEKYRLSKSEYKLFKKVPSTENHFIHSIISYFEAIKAYTVIDDKLLDKMLSTLESRNYFRDHRDTNGDIQNCINGINNNPFVRTIHAILNQREIPPQLFSSVEEAGVDDEDYEEQNFIAKCARGYMYAVYQDVRDAYMDIILSFLKKGICKLAFPIREVRNQDPNYQQFITASFLFRVAVYKYFDFIANLARVLPDDLLLRSVHEYYYMHETIRPTAAMTNFLNTNRKSFQEIKSHIEKAYKVTLDVWNTRHP